MVMETYYRKRTKNSHQHTLALTEMEAEQGSITAVQSPVLGRHHHVPPPPSSDQCTHHLYKGDEPQMQNYIEVGCLYEVDHIHLPPKTPVQLRSIRVAMVCEKTEIGVGVRYPSMESLRAFFSFSARETHPALDEKFVMGKALATKVLVRLIPPEILSEQKSLEGFWLIRCDSCLDSSSLHEKGNCLLELKGNGMVRWGIRRQVKYLGRHKENDDGTDVHIHNSSSSFVNGFEDARMELLENGCDEREREEAEDTGNGNEDGNDDDGDGEEKDKEDKDVEKDEGGEEEEEEENDDDDEEDEEEEKIQEANKNLKRKRYSFRNISNKKPKNGRQTQKRKKSKTRKNNTKTRFKEAHVLRNPKDRWSAERYKLAEQNLLEVMKAKAASAEKPILRPQLRAEARKRIGDTGLLDHLLKHMAGKLAPGGEERFRRRHNADGAMEYWLESADLVTIRKDAGVTDPYWVPPPGWRPGDSPTQDPTCARELKLLKDEITILKRELELRATKEQLEEEVGRLRREIDELCSERREEIILRSIPSEISQKLEELASSLVASKSDLEKAPVILEKYKEQLLIVSEFVKDIEAKIGVLTSKLEETARIDSSFIVQTVCTDDKEKKQMAKQPRSQKQEVQSFIAAGEESSELGKCQNKNQSAEEKAGAVEQKAAKIERLKSGFRICKPQGTFLWPNMVKNNNNSDNMMLSPHQVLVQVEVPTPPSVSSSSASAPPQMPFHHHSHRHPASPVKPLAERRAVTVTTVSKSSNFEDGSAIFNLNDPPTRPTITPMVSPSAYVPRNVMGSDEKQETACCCSSSVPSFPSTDQVVNWLALSSAFKSNSSDDSTHGET